MVTDRFGLENLCLKTNFKVIYKFCFLIFEVRLWYTNVILVRGSTKAGGLTDYLMILSQKTDNNNKKVFVFYINLWFYPVRIIFSVVPSMYLTPLIYLLTEVIESVMLSLHRLFKRLLNKGVYEV